MASRFLTEWQWAAIRQHWEFDPDEPSGDVASQRAGERLGFHPPSRQAIGKRKALDAKSGDPWQRRGSMVGIAAAAQRKADMLLARDGRKLVRDVEAAIDESIGPKPQCNQSPALNEVWVRTPEHLAEMVQGARASSEDQRAEILVRHRLVWTIIDVLRQEALDLRTENMNGAQDRIRFAKTIAETIQIQQTGERKAWGLDEMHIPDVSKKTDEELRAIVEGK